MDSFIWLILLIWGITALFGKNSKKKKETNRSPYAPPAQAKPAKPITKPAAMPAQTLTTVPVRQQVAEVPAVEQPTVRASIAPRVHTHVAPGGPAHDVQGSMAFQSTEGVDLCHEDMLPDVEKERPGFSLPEEERPGLNLQWTGDAMVKSFIMSEVLTRPCQRRRKA